MSDVEAATDVLRANVKGHANMGTNLNASRDERIKKLKKLRKLAKELIKAEKHAKKAEKHL